jgi:hypothetical protein
MNPSQRHDLTLKLDRYLSDEARLGDPDLRPDQGTLVDRFLADALNEEGLLGPLERSSHSGLSKIYSDLGHWSH